MSIFIPPGNFSLTMPAAKINVDDITSQEIQSIIDHMLEIAKGNQEDKGNGVMVGLAAPQIGISSKIPNTIFVMPLDSVIIGQ